MKKRKTEKKIAIRRIEKKAQETVTMSFSTIFSIILVIAFIATAFYVITQVLKWQKCAQLSMFTDNLRGKVNDAWDSQGADYEQQFVIPSNIEYVCFIDFAKNPSTTSIPSEVMDDISIFDGTGDNMFFYPRKKACQSPHAKIEHLDMDKIGARCIPTSGGKITLKIEKDTNLVDIKG